jgi:hypothetical protein
MFPCLFLHLISESLRSDYRKFIECAVTQVIRSTTSPLMPITFAVMAMLSRLS